MMGFFFFRYFSHFACDSIKGTSHKIIAVQWAFVGKEKRDGESFEWAVVQKAIEL